jgi:hypothetical protein
MGNFLLGAASSLLASAIVVVLTQLDDLRDLFTSSGKYRHLDGKWVKYHLTNDKKNQPPMFWSVHEEVIKITVFGRVRGESIGRHRYRIRGAIRHNVMRLRLTNQEAGELSASFTYPNLLRRDVVVGVWLGHDYDETICAGPVVLSRVERTESELAELVMNERILSIGRKRALPPIRDISTPGAA